MMVALLLYCWARGVRSSRGIERACVEDVACRVIAAHQRPDHATIARFVVRHERALGELFGEVLGAVRRRRSGDGRGDRDRRHQGARQRQPRPHDGLRAARARDRRGGDRHRRRRDRGATASGAATSCPRSGPTGRAARAGCAPPASGWTSSAPSRPSRFRARGPRGCGRPSGGWRRSWRSSATPTAIRGLPRARGDGDGRRFGAPPKPYTPPATPAGKVNITDPDSKLVKGMRGWIQGYNAQAACNEQHLIVAAEVMTASPDFGHLGPMLAAARTRAGRRRRHPAARRRASPTPATGTWSR